MTIVDRLKDEPYSGVRTLFNADIQAKMNFMDRHDWLVISKSVIVYVGETAVKNAGESLPQNVDDTSA